MSERVSGKEYEESMETLLRDHSDLDFEKQSYTRLGNKDSGGKHIPDIFLNETREIISLKTQSVGGTAEQKIPYEFIVLQEAIDKGNALSATIVLHGDGWSLKEWYMSTSFLDRIKRICPDVYIMEHDDFVEQYIPKAGVRKERGLEKFFLI